MWRLREIIILASKLDTNENNILEYLGYSE